LPSESGSAAALALIWAQAQDGVIGAGGDMPWHLPEDLAHFRELTGTDAVIMGRRTWESIPDRFRPLKDRRNIVVTRSADWAAEGAEAAHSLAEAVALVAGDPAWVIGGGELYRTAIDEAGRLEVTEIDLDVAGDTLAPPVDDSWTLSDTGEWQESRTGLRYRFLRYDR
jgi:dihydrofolate reductase